MGEAVTTTADPDVRPRPCRAPQRRRSGHLRRHHPRGPRRAQAAHPHRRHVRHCSSIASPPNRSTSPPTSPARSSTASTRPDADGGGCSGPFRLRDRIRVRPRVDAEDDLVAALVASYVRTRTSASGPRAASVTPSSSSTTWSRISLTYVAHPRPPPALYESPRKTLLVKIPTRRCTASSTSPVQRSGRVRSPIPRHTLHPIGLQPRGHVRRRVRRRYAPADT